MKRSELKASFKSAWRLLNGASCTYKTIRQGWIDFYKLRNLLVKTENFGKVMLIGVTPALADPLSWSHPWDDDGVQINSPPKGSTSKLFQWAAGNVMFPVKTELPWSYLREILRIFYYLLVEEHGMEAYVEL